MAGIGVKLRQIYGKQTLIYLFGGIWVRQRGYLEQLFYMLGLYIRNFEFWTTPMRIVEAKSFVYAPEHDLTICLAKFTNLSATTAIISRTEMHFYDCCKMYSEAVIGGRRSRRKGRWGSNGGTVLGAFPCGGSSAPCSKLYLLCAPQPCG